MKLVIGVFGQPAAKALPFAKAAVIAGHDITQVFFYGDGIFCANSDWQSVCSTLLVCSTSVYKRGVSKENLMIGFQISGLGQFMQALQDADRYMIFGQ